MGTVREIDPRGTRPHPARIALVHILGRVDEADNGEVLETGLGHATRCLQEGSARERHAELVCARTSVRLGLFFASPRSFSSFTCNLS